MAALGSAEGAPTEDPEVGLLKQSGSDKDHEVESTKVVSATTEEAPLNTQMFWLGVWMVK